MPEINKDFRHIFKSPAEIFGDLVPKRIRELEQKHRCYLENYSAYWWQEKLRNTPDSLDIFNDIQIIYRELADCGCDNFSDSRVEIAFLAVAKNDNQITTKEE